jgi:UDPglucose--hexose-1-phosphate uridylyltransferase
MNQITPSQNSDNTQNIGGQSLPGGPLPSSPIPNNKSDNHRNRLNLNTEGMKTEVRRDYIHDYYVLIAPKRAGRPYDAAASDHPLVETSSSPRLDLQTEVFTLANDKGDGWAVKVVENKFPALTPDNPDAYGAQEIVIDTPLRNVAFGELPTSQIEKVLLTYQSRSQALHDMPHIKYVSIFRNDGYEAGASLAHAHSQIFALPFEPPRLRDEARAIQQFVLENDRDPYDDIIHFEKREDLRIIAENDDWLSFTPYAPQWQMEAWILPKRAHVQMGDLEGGEIASLAPLFKQITSRLNNNDINFNLSVEEGVTSHQRLTFKFKGRNVVSPWGGLEVSTGIIINTIPPEAAAEWYRSRS